MEAKKCLTKQQMKETDNINSGYGSSSMGLTRGTESQGLKRPREADFKELMISEHQKLLAAAKTKEDYIQLLDWPLKPLRTSEQIQEYLGINIDKSGDEKAKEEGVKEEKKAEKAAA